MEFIETPHSTSGSLITHWVHVLLVRRLLVTVDITLSLFISWSNSWCFYIANIQSEFSDSRGVEGIYYSTSLCVCVYLWGGVCVKQLWYYPNILCIYFFFCCWNAFPSSILPSRPVSNSILHTHPCFFFFFFFIKTHFPTSDTNY